MIKREFIDFIKKALKTEYLNHKNHRTSIIYKSNSYVITCLKRTILMNLSIVDIKRVNFIST